MNIKTMAITSLGNLIIGGALFKDILGTVRAVNNANITGAEKKAEVKKQLANTFRDLSEWLVNFGIELAVAWVKQQQK